MGCLCWVGGCIDAKSHLAAQWLVAVEDVSSLRRCLQCTPATQPRQITVQRWPNLPTGAVASQRVTRYAEERQKEPRRVWRQAQRLDNSIRP